MDIDAARARLLTLIATERTDLKTVSLAIGKNHAYLQQFVRSGKPLNLPEGAREALGTFFDVDPDEFRAEPPARSPTERALLRNFRILSERNQRTLVDVSEGLARGAAPGDRSPDDDATTSPVQKKGARG